MPIKDFMNIIILIRCLSLWGHGAYILNMIEGTVTFSLYSDPGLPPVFFGCQCSLKVRTCVNKLSMRPIDGQRSNEHLTPSGAWLSNQKGKNIGNTKGSCHRWDFTTSRSSQYFWTLNSLSENLRYSMLYWLEYHRIYHSHSSIFLSL